MRIPCMVDAVHAKFGWISILVKGETLPAKGVLANRDKVHALCYKMVEGNPAITDCGGDFELEEVVFPRSDLLVTSKAGEDITDEFLAFTQTIGE